MGNGKDDPDRGQDGDPGTGEENPFQNHFDLSPGVQLGMDPNPGDKTGQNGNGDHQHVHVQPALFTQQQQVIRCSGDGRVGKITRQGAAGNIADLAQQQAGSIGVVWDHLGGQGANHQRLNDLALKAGPERQNDQGRYATPECSAGAVVKRE